MNNLLKNESSGKNNKREGFVKPKFKPDPERVIDFAVYTDHITICIPIQCGLKVGRVFTFSHKDHLPEDVAEYYKLGLKSQIEIKKYLVSEKVGYDVGPTIAIAELIEDDDYARFIKLFETKGTKLCGLEHVFLVEEEGRFRHLLPTSDICAFANYEQIGLLRYSIFSVLKGGLPPDALPEEVLFRALFWLTSRDIDLKKFRDFLESCRINSFEGFQREYKNCIILDDVIERMRRKFRLDEELQSFSL